MTVSEHMKIHIKRHYLFSVCIVYWHSNKTHVIKHNLQVNRETKIE